MCLLRCCKQDLSTSWISVDERLPKIDELVLVLIPGYIHYDNKKSLLGYQLGRGYFEGWFTKNPTQKLELVWKTSFLTNFSSLSYDSSVTHWMPIEPLIPKEK